MKSIPKTYLDDVNISQSLHSVLTDKILDVDNILMLQRQQNPHLSQGSLKNIHFSVVTIKFQRKSISWSDMCIIDLESVELRFIPFIVKSPVIFSWKQRFSWRSLEYRWRNMIQTNNEIGLPEQPRECQFSWSQSSRKIIEKN